METFHRDQDACPMRSMGKPGCLTSSYAFGRLMPMYADSSCTLIVDFSIVITPSFIDLFGLGPPTPQNQVVSPMAVRMPACAPVKPSWHGADAISVWVGFNFQGTKTRKGIVFIQIIRYNITEHKFSSVKITV